MKVKSFASLLLLLILSAFPALATNGDVRTTTIDGVTWTYTIVSESSKTCELGGVDPYNDESYYTAIATSITGAITTPATLDGYKVIALSSESFRECKISSITVSSGVTIVDEKVFMDCNNLTSVNLPNGVTFIGEEAFSGCSMSSITLPASLVRIGEQAFEHTRLTTITIPKNVAYLGNEEDEEDDLYADIFNGCSLLQEVIVASENQTYADVNGILFTKDLKTLLLRNLKKNLLKN